MDRCDCGSITSDVFLRKRVENKNALHSWRQMNALIWKGPCYVEPFLVAVRLSAH